ncbi:palmitoyl-protein thioesterase ABHD10, mitochondrial-like isoform X3 [Anguilla rostrata]|uniref:palmitoyl-protein thioesterase ABHD10, mitochondrial-like isoform X3 n=1 Tax=Anguilla rostrata TaxID=7938 RepID=UPI0030CC8714
MAASVLRGFRRVAPRIVVHGKVSVFSDMCLGGVRQKSTVQYVTRPDLPKLAYRKVKGKSPGVVFLPGFASSMAGLKAEALEEFCKSLGHAFLRFDYTGCGASEGVWTDCSLGSWKRDVLYVLDELVEGPQVRKEIEEKGEWVLASKHSEEGAYKLSLDFLQEAESHCVLQGPIPVTCPVRLIHGLKDPDVPWHISMQVAERVLSNDVDIILRKHGQHRMSDKDDVKLMVYTIDDLIDKLTTMA